MHLISKSIDPSNLSNFQKFMDETKDLNRAAKQDSKSNGELVVDMDLFKEAIVQFDLVKDEVDLHCMILKGVTLTPLQIDFSDPVTEIIYSCYSSIKAYREQVIKSNELQTLDVVKKYNPELLVKT
jgi:hypothetical protein